MLKPKYIALYRVLGISALPDGTDVELASVRPGLTFRLSADPEGYAAVIDHRTAVANVHLDSLFGEGQPQGSLEERIDASVERARADRQKRGGNGGFLIVLATDDTLDPKLDKLQDHGSFHTVWEAIPSGHFPRLVQGDLERVLASIALALPSNVTWGVEKVAEAAFLEDEETGKLTYSLSLRLSARGYVLLLEGDDAVLMVDLEDAGKPGLGQDAHEWGVRKADLGGRWATERLRQGQGHGRSDDKRCEI